MVTNERAYILCEVQCERPDSLVVLNNTTFAFLDKQWLRIHSIVDGDTHNIYVKDMQRPLSYSVNGERLLLYDHPRSEHRYHVQTSGFIQKGWLVIIAQLRRYATIAGTVRLNR